MKRIACFFSLLAIISIFLPVSVQSAEIGMETGGINILKTDIAGNPLKGAVFQVYRELQEGEFADHSMKKEILKIGGKNHVMILENFWPDREMCGEKQQTIISDESGTASIYGLSYGTYYLVEKRAPQGYNRILEPVRITIHKYSHLTSQDEVYDDQDLIIDNTLHIINMRYLLPDTGNSGAIQLALGGTGILFSSAALLMLNRKRWR